MSRFSLNIDTPPEWASKAEPHMSTILLDHAHCEKRAASTALNFIFRYPSVPGLVRTMTELCREEMQHFAQVCALLENRGIAYAALVPSSYAGDLMSQARKSDPDRLLDHLLVAALIEARSCERFEVLAQGLEDRRLADFFHRLSEAEARHFEVYIELAQTQAQTTVVETRLRELASVEGRAAARCTPEPRLHCSFGLLAA